MNPDIESVLVTEEEIKIKVKEIGNRISADFSNLNPMFIGILKGSFMFMSDLMRNVDISCSADFMGVSSYGTGTTSTGAVSITKDLQENIENRNVILVEDILDSGMTLNYLINILSVRNPASISTATFLDKPSRRKKPIYADYVGVEIPNVFVVGYGLDYAEKYRNLPYIGILKPEIYAE